MTTLADATVDQLLSEIRNRGTHVLSVWSAEDVGTAHDNDDGMPELTEDQNLDYATALLNKAGSALEDVLGTRGNEYLGDAHYMYRDEILVELGLATAAPAL